MLISSLKNRIKKYFKKSKLIIKGETENLYKTKDGFYYWLNSNKYLDREIINFGVFEPKSTNIVKQIVNPGDTVLDIGANIGYYTVLLSNIVGSIGKVLAFEPTKCYRGVLKKNIEANKMTNTTVFNFGLSDASSQIEIYIGESSATLHWAEQINPKSTEKITLKKLDEILNDLKIQKIDFIKIDIDGHESAFLKGALKVLNKYSPVILLEVNHLNYLCAGVNIMDFYKNLKQQNYYIYSEISKKEIKNLKEFLMECGNMTHSANIIISKKDISKKLIK